MAGARHDVSFGRGGVACAFRSLRDLTLPLTGPPPLHPWHDGGKDSSESDPKPTPNHPNSVLPGQHECQAAANNDDEQERKQDAQE